jgi:hypothetical protein
MHLTQFYRASYPSQLDKQYCLNQNVWCLKIRSARSSLEEDKYCLYPIQQSSCTIPLSRVTIHLIFAWDSPDLYLLPW